MHCFVKRHPSAKRCNEHTIRQTTEKRCTAAGCVHCLTNSARLSFVRAPSKLQQSMLLCCKFNNAFSVETFVSAIPQTDEETFVSAIPQTNMLHRKGMLSLAATCRNSVQLNNDFALSVALSHTILLCKHNNPVPPWLRAKRRWRASDTLQRLSPA